jgi:hypothetical protein
MTLRCLVCRLLRGWKCRCLRRAEADLLRVPFVNADDWCTGVEMMVLYDDWRQRFASLAKQHGADCVCDLCRAVVNEGIAWHYVFTGDAEDLESLE